MKFGLDLNAFNIKSPIFSSGIGSLLPIKIFSTFDLIK